MQNLISEKTIEDILSADNTILSEILNVNSSDLNLIARQKVLPSGKLDLLLLYKNELFLIELKVTPFYNKIIDQINGYQEDILSLQKSNKIIKARVNKIVLITQCSKYQIEQCTSHNIKLILYDPEDVLRKFYENFKELSQIFKIQSGDFGVVRIALIKNTLSLLNKGEKIEDISKIERRSIKTIKNRLSVASLLNLVVKIKGIYFLTDFGNEFLAKDSENIDNLLSNDQCELLSNFIIENPFYSSITYTIFTLVESLFFLSKNIYPVPMTMLIQHFVKSVGKEKTWKTRKARETATYIFSNYAIEIDFISKINNSFYLNPKGLRAILLLQLNRSIKLIESQK